MSWKSICNIPATHTSIQLGNRSHRSMDQGSTHHHNKSLRVDNTNLVPGLRRKHKPRERAIHFHTRSSGCRMTVAKGSRQSRRCSYAWCGHKRTRCRYLCPRSGRSYFQAVDTLGSARSSHRRRQTQVGGTHEAVLVTVRVVRRIPYKYRVTEATYGIFRRQNMVAQR
jgi:hypothetical protein